MYSKVQHVISSISLLYNIIVKKSISCDSKSVELHDIRSSYEIVDRYKCS